MSISPLWPYQLRHGAAPDPSQGACAMQAINWLVHGKTSDAPVCVDPNLTEYVILFNDRAISVEERDRLLPYLPRIAGSRNDNLMGVRAAAGLVALLERFRKDDPRLEAALQVAKAAQRDLAHRGDDIRFDDVERAMRSAFGNHLLGSRLCCLCECFHAMVGRVPYGGELFNTMVSAEDRDGIDMDLALIFLEAYLNAGPQGEPWSADRVDAAVKSFQAAGGPPVPATT